MRIIKNRKQIRLRNFNYSDNGWYFVTVCTKDRKEYFGNINKYKMILNKFGLLIKENWEKLVDKFSIELDKFIVMPNHMHGIIVIKQNIVGVSFMKPEIKMVIAKSNHHMGLMNQTPTLGLIIRYFKSKCTYKLHKNGFNNNLWQRNYYEHIIRNEYSLNRIRQYIENNPINWDEDRNNITKGGDIK